MTLYTYIVDYTGYTDHTDHRRL